MEFIEIIKASIPMKLQTGGHPAKRTFQAIRIEVNKELEVLENTIDTMIDLLNDEGRLFLRKLTPFGLEPINRFGKKIGANEIKNYTTLGKVIKVAKEFNIEQYR